MTTSAPVSLHGRAAGSRSAKTLSSLPSTTIASSVCSTVPGKRPRIESYLRRWASVLVSVMSLTPTQSMSAPAACAARNTLRPMRPKPLIPAFSAIQVLSLGNCVARRPGQRAGESIGLIAREKRLAGHWGFAAELAGDASDSVVEARVLIGAPVGDECVQGLSPSVDQALRDCLAAAG